MTGLWLTMMQITLWGGLILSAKILMDRDRSWLCIGGATLAIMTVSLLAFVCGRSFQPYGVPGYAACCIVANILIFFLGTKFNKVPESFKLKYLSSHSLIPWVVTLFSGSSLVGKPDTQRIMLALFTMLVSSVLCFTLGSIGFSAYWDLEEQRELKDEEESV